MKTKYLKPILFLLCVHAFLLGALLLPGCKTGADGKKHVDSDRVARVAGTAAQLGAQIYLAKNPDKRPAFATAEAALTGLIDRENYDPGAFAAALQTLPIKELRGKDGVLYVSAALLVWDEVAAQASGIDQVELVKKTMLSVRDGLRRALVPP